MQTIMKLADHLKNVFDVLVCIWTTAIIAKLCAISLACKLEKNYQSISQVINELFMPRDSVFQLNLNTINDYKNTH